MGKHHPYNKILIAAADGAAADADMIHERAPGESPIEEYFFTALYVTAKYVRPYVRTDVLTKDSLWARPIEALMNDIVVFPQAKIGKYRIDFLIAIYDFCVADLDERHNWIYDEKHWKYLVVECDGHDFHERTKEQAAKDRRRDRELGLQGYKVFRFTGSEIWRDPIKCATDVILWSEDPK